MKKLIFVAALMGLLLGGISYANQRRSQTNWKNLVRGNAKVTAFSMDAGYDESKVNPKKPSFFHDEFIVSQKVISNPKDINQLRKLVLSLDGSYRPDSGYDCGVFYRHGIRFQKGSQKVDAIICFQCGESMVFEPNGKSHTANVNPKWLKTLNALYIRNKMRLPAYYEEHSKTRTHD